MILALLFACSGTGEDSAADTAGACADAPHATWVSFGDGFFATYCRACHSATTTERFGAPPGVNFDTLDDVRSFEASIRRTVIDEQSMPEAGGVYEDDLYLLDWFLTCGL